MPRQAMVGFTSLGTLATVVVWLPTARGETTTMPVVLTRFGPFAMTETCLIWLPAARGESSASLALTLMVIAAKAAALIVARSVRIFILTFFFWVALHCAAGCCMGITPASWKPLKKLQAPAGKVDPPAGTGIMKPRVGCWQSKLDPGQGALI